MARRPLLSTPLQAQLRKAFGVQGAAFFEFAEVLRRVFTEGESAIPEEGLVDSYVSAGRLVARYVVTDPTRNLLSESLSSMRVLLTRIERKEEFGGEDLMLFKQAVPLLVRVYREVAADRDVFMMPMSSGAPTWWPGFRKMTDKEERMERLRRADPDAYQRIQEGRALVKNLERSLEAEIREGGLEVSRKQLMGRPVLVGTDAVTGESLIFDVDSEPMTPEEYVEYRKEKLKEFDRASRIFVEPKDLLQVSPEELEALLLSSEPVEQVALTDDKAKTNQLTRVLPAKRTAEGRQVVVGGRYKGIYVDELVNRAGRLIEGSAYNLNVKTRLPEAIELKGAGGVPNIRTQREPYATALPDGRLYVRIPSGHAFTQIRNSMAKVASLIPSIEYLKDSRKSGYYIQPNDFAAVRDALDGSLILSATAMATLQKHFMDQARMEVAIEPANLQFFDTEKIGGFKPGMQLFRKQKEAMAWVTARGGSGLCALDTGIGKCVTGDTLVWTNKGLVEIQALNPGQTEEGFSDPLEGLSVQTQGATHPLNRFYYSGMKDTIKLHTNSGLELEGSLEHPVLVAREGGPVFVKLRDLHVGDVLCVDRTPKAFAEQDALLPSMQNWAPHPSAYTVKYEPLPTQMTPSLARLFAYMVGEGYMVSRMGFTITQDLTLNPEVYADIRALLQEQGWGFEEVAPPNHAGYFRVPGVRLREFLVQCGIDLVKSAGKEVPWSILQSSRESVRQFLRAYIDAEGSMSGGVLEVSSASRRMLQQLQVLLLGFGIRSTRRTKVVSGYEQNYYGRLHMCGTDVRTYLQEIGFVSSRKKAKAEALLGKKVNTNVHLIPHQVAFARAIKEALAFAGPLPQVTSVSFASTLKNIYGNLRRQMSYPFVSEVLQVMAQAGVAETHPVVQHAKALLEQNWLYDPVVSLEAGQAEVMDIEVGHESHMFTANGIASHNTALALTFIQKAIRDGSEKRFLYVCPTALRGNLSKEAAIFMEDAKQLMGRVDVLSYTEFLKRTQADPSFGSEYEQVFFDEAQAMRTPTSKTSIAAQRLPNDKKVLLTGSPMDRSPMDVFALIAISNNLDMSTAQGKKTLAAFRKRFCEEVGGKIIGLKNDPETAKAFRTFIKQNLYFADKKDVEEIVLPQLRKESVAITMEPEVEAKYREAAAGVADVLREMVRKYRDRDPSATSKAVETARIKLRKQFTLLFEIANFPEKFVPGAVSPKMTQMVEILDEKVSVGSRSIVFTDSPALASSTAKELSRRFPMKLHAECQAKEILVWQSGRVVRTYKQESYTDAKGRVWPAGQWKVYVMESIVKPNPSFLSCVLTSTYAVGQNLQTFDTVIHLDRDSWNNEIMKQRTARAWRTGQQHSVSEYVLDAAYDAPLDSQDATLDQIARYLQELDAELFDRVVVESQSEALGKDWFEMPKLQSSFVELNRKLMEIALSPTARRLANGA